MKKHLFLKSLLVLIGVLIGSLSSPLLADNITSDGDVYLYFNMTSPYNWWNMGTNGSQNFTYFWGTSGSAWSIAAIQVDGDMYAIKVPSGTWGNMILVRNKDTSADWGNWNQSNDQTLSSSHNYLTEFHANDQSDSYKNSQWDDYIPTSTASLSASSTSITTAQTSTLTPSLTSNTDYNAIKSTSYSVTTNPGSAGSVTNGKFSATAAGTYVVRATVTYNAKGFTGITNTATAEVTITVAAAVSNTLTVQTDGHGSITTPSGGSTTYSLNTPVSIVAADGGGYTFSNWTVTSGTATVTSPTSKSTTVTVTAGTSATVQANFVEKMTTITINADPASSGTFTLDAAAFSEGATTTAGVATSHDVVATARPGYKFASWGISGNATGTSSTNTYTLKGNGSGSTGTLTANFDRTYAYIEGRFKVRNSARSSETTTYGNNQDWNESSTNIQMEYEEANHRFVLHTYSTPKELSENLKNYEPFFYIKTSTSNSSLANPVSYQCTSSQTLSSTGRNNGKNVATSGGANNNLKFNSNDESGYVVIYFDESKIWYELEQSLTYHANYHNTDVSGAVPATTYHLKGSSATVADKNTLAMTNYTFEGWNTAQYITGTGYAVGGSITMNANVDLYGVWKRSIPMDDQGATTGVSTTVYGTYNCTTITAHDNPEKTGYTFGGWYSQVAGGGSYVITPEHVLNASKNHWTDASARFTRNPTSVSSLYAKWTQTVVLDANIDYHGTGDNGSLTATYNGGLSSKTHTTAATGYTREGYYTAPTGGTKVLTNTGSFASTNVTDYITSSTWTKDGATTLYAHYTPITYYVAYNNGGGSGSMTNSTYTYDVAAALRTCTFGPPSGKSFAGWATEENGDVVYTDGQSVSNLTSTNGSTVTLYAVWEETTNWKLYRDGVAVATFTLNDGIYTLEHTFTADNQSLLQYGYYNGSTSYYHLGAFSIIDGSWHQLTGPSAGRYNWQDGAGIFVISIRNNGGNWEIKAQKKYTITYNENGATSGTKPANQLALSGTSPTVAANSGSLTKTYYTFSGWNTATDGSGTHYAAGSGTITSIAADVTLYAEWTPVDLETAKVDGPLFNGWDNCQTMNKSTSGSTVTTYTYSSGNHDAGNYEFCVKNSSCNSDAILKYSNSLYSLTATNCTVESSDAHDSEGHNNFYVTTTKYCYVTITVVVTNTSSKKAIEVTIEAIDVTPTYYIQHNWNEAGWTWKECNIDNGDGSYSVDGNYDKDSGCDIKLGESGSSHYIAQNNSEKFKVWGSIADKEYCRVTYFPDGDSIRISKLYNVIYYGNSNTSGTVPSTVVVPHKGSFTAAAKGDLVRTNYDFGGWNTNASGTGSNYTPGTTYNNITANLNLFAKWTASSHTWKLVSEGVEKGTFEKVGSNYVLYVNIADINVGALRFKDGSQNYKPNNCDLTTEQTLPTSDNDGNFQWINSPSGHYKLTIRFDEGSSVWKVKADRVYAVTYNANGASSGSAPAKTYYDSGTASVTTAAKGDLLKTYHSFGGWNTENDGTGDTYAENTDNAFTLSNADVILYAKWDEIRTTGWHIVGTPTSVFAGGWSAINANELLKPVGNPGASQGALTINVTALGANNDSYQFKLYHENDATNVWYGWSSSDYWHLNRGANNPTVYNIDGNDHNLYFIPDALGEYIFGANWTSSNPTVTVTFPTAYAVTYGMGTGGSTVTAKYCDVSFSSGVSVQNGKTVVFTQSAASGYTFKEWNSASDGRGTKLSEDETYSHTVTTTNTVYAIYNETMHDVTLANDGHGHVEVGGATVTTANVGTSTSVTITAVPNSGYHFVNWTKSDGTVTLGDANAVSTTLNATADGKTVTANFAADEYIYFDNTFTQWDHVYVYLFNNNVWYNNKQGNDGPGVKPNHSNRVGFAEMTQVAGEENLYEFAYHNADHNYSFSYVAFCKDDQRTYNAFYSTAAAYRGDWRSTMPIYVAPSTYIEPLVNSVKYHNDGYWMMKETKVGESVGYALYNGDDGSKIADFVATADGAHTAKYVMRKDNTNDVHFFVNNIASQNYSRKDYVFGSTNSENVDIYHFETFDRGSHSMTLDPMSVGDYTFVLTQGLEHMKLTIEFPVAIGDYRLVYSYTKNATTQYRYSDIIRSGTTSQKASMYINKDDSGVALRLDKCTSFSSGQPVWTTVASGWISTYFRSMAKSVYQFDVNINESTSSYSLSNIEVYDDEYYIKTDCATGGWANYTANVLSENDATFNSADASTYDYYYCHWIGNTTTNVRCVIANKYNNAISDTLKTDDIISGGASKEVLPEKAIVRFSFNSTTDELKRTYLLGAQESDIDTYLYLKPNASDRVYSGGYDLYDNANASHRKFTDMGNYIYQLNLRVKPSAQAGVLAEYPEGGSQHVFVPMTTELMGGVYDAAKIYDVRIVYNFGTNQLISAWLAQEVGAEELTINSDVMLIRTEHAGASQITFSTGNMSDVKTVYGVMEFTKSFLTNGENSTHYRGLYMISFPFDVKLNEAFGFGTYGTDWIIQEYNGEKRAAEGAWVDSGSFWKYITKAQRSAGYTLEANKGYVLALEVGNFGSSSHFWDNGVTTISLYFPSEKPVSTINGTLPQGGAYDAPYHTCIIERDGRKYKDSNWNMIGVPSYANVMKSISGAVNVYTETGVQIDANTVPFLYNNSTGSALVAQAAGSFTFLPMHSYLVQYGGTMNWTAATLPSLAAGVAPRRYEGSQEEEHMLRMEIQNAEGENLDQTFVRFTEDATNQFDMNKDLTKAFNSGKANIYTITEDVEVAGNNLPLEEGTTFIPVGVRIPANGTYSFAMPDGTDGLEVYLYDQVSGTRTNLMLDSYEIYLTQGTEDARFLLEIGRHNNPTEIVETYEDAAGDKVVKFLQNGVLYIQRNGVIYDARGARVE